MPDYSWFLFLVDLLAIYRLTRLVTKDSLLNGPRFWILQRWPSELTQYPDSIVVERATVGGVNTGRLRTGVEVYMTPDTDGDGDPLWEAARTWKVTELLECPWCSGMWLAAIVVALRTFFPIPWGYVAVTLAFSALVGLISTHWDNG